MGERDAFGREIGEDPLAAMGWAGDRAAAAEDLAAPPARATVSPPPARRAPVSPPRVARAPRPYRRRRRPPVLVRLLVPLMAVGIAVAAAVGQVSTRGSGGGALVTPRAQLAPTTSLLRPRALRAALRQLPRGRLEYLRVSAGRIDAHVLGDRYHLVSVDVGGVVADVPVPVAVRGPRLRVNAAAPRRAAKAAARAAHVPLADVSYLVLGPHGWDLFLAGGRHFHADLAGRHVRRVR